MKQEQELLRLVTLKYLGDMAKSGATLQTLLPIESLDW